MKKPDLSDILHIGLGIGKALAPGSVGSILDVVSDGIDDKNDPANEGALKNLAETDDAQNKAILAMHERLKKVEEHLGIQ